jgi:hypothetical protein
VSETPSEPEATGVAGEPEAGSQEQEQEGERERAPVQVRLRRTPRYRAFVGVGALLGALAGIVARLLLGDPGSLFSAGTTTGYLAAIGLLLGALVGGAVAVLVDRPGR